MKKILLQWNSKNNGLIVALQAVKLLFEESEIIIDEIHLLQNSNFDKLEKAEIEHYYNPESKNPKDISGPSKDRLKEIRRASKDLKDRKIKAQIHQKRLHIKSVTNYQSIYNQLRVLLKENFKDSELHINVSPGTPQMHTVWLMLNASGHIPDSTKLLSTQRDKKQDKNTISEIKFKPKTFLSEVFDKAYQRSAKIKINPNDTHSSKRKEAEELISLFSSFPEVPILLLGERGVGKTTYVEQLIKVGPYTDLPFVVIPCGIFSEDLMRSELFGYEKGAFTGASEKKEGILSQFKIGGILFLDEIHDLSKGMQRQLMQVLESGEFLTIGGIKLQKTKFRLITASNLSYQKLSESLSLDFLDRINRYLVEIPPIRECREDIQRYWKETFENICLDKKLPISNKLSDFLQSHPFYGNFRDLQRLALYLNAFLEVNKKEKAIELAIENLKKYGHPSENKDSIFFKKGKNYNQIINHFNKLLCIWAMEEYKSRKEAYTTLDMSEAWFSKAINGKSRDE